MELTGADALALRMTSLLLREPPGGAKAPTDVAGVVEWFGAMQAQDAASGMWSLGVRLPGRWAAGQRSVAAQRPRRGRRCSTGLDSDTV